MLLSKTFGQLKTSFPYVFYQHVLINRKRLIVSTDAIQRVRFPVKNKKIFQEAKTFFVTAGEIRVAIKALAYWESSLYLTKSLYLMKFKLGLKSWKWSLNLESTKWRNFQIAFYFVRIWMSKTIILDKKIKQQWKYLFIILRRSLTEKNKKFLER